MRQNTMSVAERSSCWMKILKHKWIEGDLASKSCLVKGKGCTGHTYIWLNLFATHILWSISYFDPQFNTVNDNISSGTSFTVSIHCREKRKKNHQSMFPNKPFIIYCFLLLEAFKQQSLRKTKPHSFSSTIHLRVVSKSIWEISHTHPTSWLLWRPSQFQLQFQSHFCQPNCIV